MTAAKPPALCAYCPACGHPAVALSAKGAYRVHRCANSRAIASDANVARWVKWEEECARNSVAHSVGRLASARAELARAEASDTEARARLASITAIAASRGITPRDTDR